MKMRSVMGIVLLSGCISFMYAGAGPAEPKKTPEQAVLNSQPFMGLKAYFISSRLYLLISHLLDDLLIIDSIYTRLQKAQSLSRRGDIMQKAQAAIQMAALGGEFVVVLPALKRNGATMQGYLKRGVAAIDQLLIIDDVKHHEPLVEKLNQLADKLRAIDKSIRELNKIGDALKAGEKLKTIGTQIKKTYDLVMGYKPFKKLFDTLFADEQVAPPSFKKEAMEKFNKLKSNKKGLIGSLFPKEPKKMQSA